MKVSLLLSAFAIVVCSCSSASKLLGNFSGKEGSAPGGVANMPGPAGTQGPGGGGAGGGAGGTAIDDREMPTIEVAGVNLTSECLDPDVPGKAPESKVLHCKIKSDSDTEALMKVDKFTLKSATSENKYAATGVSGLKGTDASTWRISKAAKIDMEFEVPVAALTDMRKYPAVLAMENLTMNNMPATGNNLFKSMVKDFHTLDSLCGTSAETTLDLQLRFAEDTSSSTGTVFYGQPLTSMNLVSSKICNIAFLNDLVFEWTAEPSAEYRVAGTVGSADNLVFTSLQKVERVFGFPASFMFGDMKPTGTNLSKRMEDAGIVLPGDGSIGGAIGAYSVWCAFGVTDCMRETDPSPANGSIPPSPRKSTIHFNRIPSKYFVAFAPLFLEKSQMINYFRVRFQIYASYETAKPTLNSSTEIVNVRLTYIP